ncbi:alpha/beta hydrolase [Geojedonia litorea]|uniref:Alpha/beta hydrolase n=1 Tax=Geojedonia litorea TaxID=1268269 RepID=A0ABV9N477_9FLAO
MNKLILLCVLCFSLNTVHSQAKYETIRSNKLGEDRQLKILLPRGYNPDDTKKYPLIIVLDGDYLFEAVAGNVDYYSYWEDMPESIVVGIKQADQRYDDCMYSEQNSLPIETGAAFFEFIGMELIPYLNKTFKTENFRAIVGHGETANFINYFLFKDQPLFQAYVCIAPDLASQTGQYLTERLKVFEKKIFYYMATSSNDAPSINENVVALDKNIKALENKNLLYNFDNFEGPSHYALPAHAIPKALESIFFVFQPISKKEYTETILKLETSPVDYLLEKYKTIKELFGIEKQILVNDFKAIQAAIEKSKSFEYYEDLGKIARKEYPDTLLGSYYLARFYEETGEPKKAMKTYKSAYILQEIGGITKDLMLEKAEEIKADFGF